MILEVDDNQSQRENVMGNILSKNIKFVSVYDHLDRSTEEYMIGIRTRDRGMIMERVWDWVLNQGPRDEDGKIREGWGDTIKIVIYKKDGKVQ